MQIIKTVRVGRQTFKNGDEEEFLKVAAASPELVDFQRLLALDAITEIPFTADLTPEAKQKYLQEQEAIRLKAVEAANARAEQDAAAEKAKIQEAHERARQERAEQERVAKQDAAKNSTPDGEVPPAV